MRVATGDVNGDGLPDLITAPGLGRNATIRAYSGTPNAAGDYAGGMLFAIRRVCQRHSRRARSWRWATSTATAPTTSSPAPTPVSAASARVRREPPRRRPPCAAPALLAAFNAYANSFRGGVRVAAGDLNGDGRAEIVTGSGGNMVGTVNIYNGNGFGKLQSLLPFGRGKSPGLFVTVGDLNGDGVRDLAVSSDGGKLPMVAVVSGRTLASAVPAIARFLAFPNNHRGGVRVTAKPTDGGNPGFVESADLQLSGGPGGGAASRRVRQARFNAALTPVVTDKIFASAGFDGLYLG